MMGWRAIADTVYRGSTDGSDGHDSDPRTIHARSQAGCDVDENVDMTSAG
jgi:hypothetical protein